MHHTAPLLWHAAMHLYSSSASAYRYALVKQHCSGMSICICTATLLLHAALHLYISSASACPMLEVELGKLFLLQERCACTSAYHAGHEKSSAVSAFYETVWCCWGMCCCLNRLSSCLEPTTVRGVSKTWQFIVHCQPFSPQVVTVTVAVITATTSHVSNTDPNNQLMSPHGECGVTQGWGHTCLQRRKPVGMQQRILGVNANSRNRCTHLCSWLAWPSGWSRCSLECRSCSCPSPQTVKARSTVVVASPTCTPHCCQP